MDHRALLFCGGIVAGAMNALAGGGSFVSLPVLIAVGLPSVQANASSTVALFPGGVVSAWSFRKGLGSVGPVTLGSLLLATAVGGATGALLLLRTPPRVFDLVLPWLLLLASLTLSFGREWGPRLQRHWRVSPMQIVIIQFLLGIYGGYFGGAVGIMMMAVWGLLDDRDLKSMSAPRTLFVSAANAMAVLTFIVAHSVRWPETIVMLVAASIGGYGGAQIGRRASPRAVRAYTVFLTAGITLIFFARAYVKTRRF